MESRPLCEVCGDNPATCCDECARQSWEIERDAYFHDMGAIWNAIFPNERDDWDYGGQMSRLILPQVVFMRAQLEERGVQLPAAGFAPPVDESEYAPRVDSSD